MSTPKLQSVEYNAKNNQYHLDNLGFVLAINWNRSKEKSTDDNWTIIGLVNTSEEGFALIAQHKSFIAGKPVSVDL